MNLEQVFIKGLSLHSECSRPSLRAYLHLPLSWRMLSIPQMIDGSHRPLQSNVPNKAQSLKGVYYVPVRYHHGPFLQCLCSVLLQFIDDAVRDYQKWSTSWCLGHYLSSLTVRVPVPIKHRWSRNVANILVRSLLITLDASYAIQTPTFTSL